MSDSGRDKARTAFTPGPWKVQEADDDTFYVYTEANELPIAQAFGGSTRISEMGRLRSQRRANARLIAAAPTMFEALKRIAASDYDEIGGSSTESTAEEIAAAAIAAATGVTR